MISRYEYEGNFPFIKLLGRFWVEFCCCLAAVVFVACIALIQVSTVMFGLALIIIDVRQKKLFHFEKMIKCLKKQMNSSLYSQAQLYILLSYLVSSFYYISFVSDIFWCSKINTCKCSLLKLVYTSANWYLLIQF